jgi:hypothetical protein
VANEKLLPGFAYRCGVSNDAPLFVNPLAEQYSKAVDTKKLSVTAVLTYPVPDRAGDEVRPNGGDWTFHKATPWIGIEHFRWHRDGKNIGHIGQPGITSEPVVVAWARESLEEDGAPYAMQLKSVKIDGHICTLPVGTSYFDPNDKRSMQTFSLIKQDALPGVSVEFTPVEKSVRLAQSPLENRPAYNFDKWNGLGWVHCAIPVNPGALVCKSIAARDQLTKILRDKKIGNEQLDPVIYKSLSRYLPPTNKRTTVTVERKAMFEDDAPETDYDENNPMNLQDGDGDEPPPLNGVQAFYNKAQRIIDSCEQLKNDLQNSDSPELRKKAMKVIDKLTSVAEEVKSIADAHDAKLSSSITTDMGDDDGDEMEMDEEAVETDGDGAEVEEEEVDDVDMTKDEDGVLKAVRPCYYKALKVHRFKLAEINKAKTVDQQLPFQDFDTPAPSQADVEELKKAIKKLKRAKALYG